VTRDELLARLKQDESALIERKEAPHQTEVAETVVAFANSTPPDREAVLFLGQRADKTITGLAGDVDKVQRKVIGWVTEYCYPPVTVHLEVLDGVGPSPVLAVVVPGGSRGRPHFAGPAFVRVGSVTKEAPPELYEDLIASRNTVAGAILRHKGEAVTVVIQQRWAATWNAPETIVPIATECRIEGCSAHSVELRNISSSTLQSIALERVVVTADPKNQRPLMLTIKPE
jgi:hypothetical protein